MSLIVSPIPTWPHTKSINTSKIKINNPPLKLNSNFYLSYASSSSDSKRRRASRNRPTRSSASLAEGLQMERGEASSTKKLERKTIEKNRRILMKALGFKLVSMIPDRHFSQPKEFLSQLDQIDEATAYIMILRERIEKLKRRNAELQSCRAMKKNVGENAGNELVNVGGWKLPVVSAKELGGCRVEVVLMISGIFNTNYMLSKAITIIEQEAAQMLSVNICRDGDNVIYTLHAQVKICRVGVDISRISERIHEMIISSSLCTFLVID